MDEYMIFAERLTAEMERQELSYRQLAEKMGITVTTLFRYAKGQRVPKATEIVKASRVLCVTCDYLIGLSDDPHKTSTESVYHPVSVNTDLISRQAAIDAVEKNACNTQRIMDAVNNLPSAQPYAIYSDGRLWVTVDDIDKVNAVVVDESKSKFCKQFYMDAQPDLGKYEYHYDHTDCIWYRPEARNRCPVTCAQYRDGWNDAMNYIFRDGKGYRPYRRGEQYE